jgi:long-chain fatty acid transport protein
LKFVAPYEGKLTTGNLSYVLGYKVNERLSVGLGVNGYASTLSFKQDYPWASVTGNPASPIGNAEVDTLGFGIGASAGVTYKVTEDQRVAFSVRSPFSISYEGDFKVSNTPDASQLPPPARGVTSRSDASTDIDFPTIVTLGYGIQLTEKVRVSSDIEWIQFSNFESLDVDLENNTLLLPNNGRSAQDWNDTFTYGLAVTWDVNDKLNARAGAVYLETPVPEKTLSPSFADDDHPVYTLGLGYDQGEQSVIDVGVAVGIYDTRTVSGNNNPAYNGKYDFENFLLTVSWTRGF